VSCYLSAGTKEHHYHAPAEMAPLLLSDMIANKDIACKHEPPANTAEQKPGDPDLVRTASLLPLAGTAIQDAARKQDIPELDIKEEVDLTLSR
jgi:hypothetical protein